MSARTDVMYFVIYFMRREALRVMAAASRPSARWEL